MPQFRVEAIETIKTKVNITISAKTAEAAKRILQKAVGKNSVPLKYDKWYADDNEVIEREVLSVKQEPSKAERKAKQAEYSRRSNQIDERVRKHIKKQNKTTPIYVQFSAYEFEDEEQDLPKVDTLDFVPIKGKVVVFEHDSRYISPVMEDPTWLQLCHIANEQIKYSDDHHHVFLESIDVEKRVPQWVTVSVASKGDRTSGIQFCTFGMGS